jgi:hypothetical protein
LDKTPYIGIIEHDFMDKKNIITLWGIVDLTSLGWYTGWRIIHGQIPFYHDISKSIQYNTLSGTPSWSIITILSLLLYLSLLFSGIYLIQRRRIGAIISYIQTPFRFLLLIPPSIFFIAWPLKYIFNSESIRTIMLNQGPSSMKVIAFLTFVSVVLLSEILKLYSVISWHRKLKTV